MSYLSNAQRIFNKQLRDKLTTKVRNTIRSQHPNYEQNIGAFRYPVLPKIILYSSVASSESFFRTIFPFYNIITPKLTSETDQDMTRRIAEELAFNVDNQQEIKQDRKFGYILQGFPFNINQALLLDGYLNGVNLAIHLKHENESPDYVESIKPLLNYYDERGTLMELEHKQEPSFEDYENLINEIRMKIKRSY